MVELLEKQKKISALKPSSLNPVYKISSASKTACVLQKRIKELPSPHGIQSKTIRVFSGEAQVSSNKLPKIGSTDSKKSNAEIRTKNYTNVVRLPRIASGKESRGKFEVSFVIKHDKFQINQSPRENGSVRNAD